MTKREKEYAKIEEIAYLQISGILEKLTNIKEVIKKILVYGYDPEYPFASISSKKINLERELGRAIADIGKMTEIGNSDMSNIITFIYKEDRRRETLQNRIKELENGLKEIAIWSQEDQDNPETCALQWRGCVAIARGLLEEKK